MLNTISEKARPRLNSRFNLSEKFCGSEARGPSMDHRTFDLTTLSLGRHLYQFYKSHHDYLRFMIPFFQTGLEKGEACLWLLSEKNHYDETYVFVEKTLPRFSFYRELNQLQILPAEDWYLCRGAFDEEQALSNIGRYVERMEAKGFQRWRASGDVGAIVPEDRIRFSAYERKVHPLIKERSLTALCAYPLYDCNLPQIKSVVDCHDGVLAARP